MNRLLAVAPVSATSFVVALLLSAMAIGVGYVPDDALRLWAGAVTAGEGDVSIGRIVAGYPTIPFLSTTWTAWIAPAGTPAPALVTAVVMAAILTNFFVAFRRAGLSAWVAGLSAFLIGFHPMFLRAIVAGPADAFFALFLFLTGKGLYNLRARSGTSEVMAVGIALLGLAFSHPIGAATAFALTPFLAFALTPALVRNSAVNIVVALIFPTLLAIGGFSYVSWVFPGAGWSFFTAPAESLATWSASIAHVFGENVAGWLAIHAGLTVLVAVLLGAPVVPVTLAWVLNRKPLVAPPLVLLAGLTVAAITAAATGLFGDPAALAVAAPVLAALAVARIPLVPARLDIVLPLLAVGWLGGAVAMTLVDPMTANRALASFEGQPRDKERLDALATGGALINREGVLIDSHNAPGLIVGRGSAKGIFDPASEPFTLALMFNRLETPFVAVPDPQSLTGAGDKLNKAFPGFYRNGAPGYREVYRNATWRVFTRTEKSAVQGGRSATAELSLLKHQEMGR